MRFVPRFPRPYFVPSFAPSGAPQAPGGKAGGDPRDGLEPPALPAQSPANPLAVAQLLAGTEAITIAQVPGILGAPVAQLLRDPSSILYNGRAVARAATKASGAPDGGKVVTVMAPYIPPAKGAPMMAPVVAAALVTAKGGDPSGEQATLAWALAQLAASGVNCAAWTAMGEPGRINTTRNFFYSAAASAAAQLAALNPKGPQRPPLPTLAEDLRDAINAACGLPPGPRVSVLTGPAQQQAPSAEVKAGWLRQMNAAGVTCAQWSGADPPAQADGGRSAEGRLNIVRALIARRLLVPGGNWDDWAVFRGIESACAAAGGPAVDPAASVRARLAAILDCANLDAQDKFQQIAVIQRAFPELTRDPHILYRLALARYDACHPATEPGWNGRGASMLYDPAPVIRTWVEHSTDILGGDTAGMSWAQWVKQGPYMPATGPDLFDPIQGAVGDCYFVAAMAALAWTKPDVLMQTGQPTGPDRRRFVFSGSAVDVSDRTPCQILKGYLPIFCRSNRLDANWPGVIEKAYAAYRTRDAGDRPDITRNDNHQSGSAAGARLGVDGLPLTNTLGAGGAIPLVDITGRPAFWHLNYFRSDDATFDLVATYCTPDGRARAPMVAATYGAGGFVDRTGLVAGHAYTILGFGFSPDGRKFVVLRNPWGWHNVNPGFLVPLPSRWLGRLNLNSGEGGCFALAHGAFSAAFAWFYGAQ